MTVDYSSATTKAKTEQDLIMNVVHKTAARNAFYANSIKLNEDGGNQPARLFILCHAMNVLMLG